MKAAISRIHHPVTTLGYGQRVGVWFQGCSIRCVGCVSMDTWAPGQGITELDSLFSTIEPFLKYSDGITITGGEPFDQPDALMATLRWFKNRHVGDVLVFSGYQLEKLDLWLPRFEGLIDAIIADPFDMRSPQTLVLRGSDNQRLVTLTALGEIRYSEYRRERKKSDRAFDVMFDDTTGEVFLAGIPSADDLNNLKGVIELDGGSVAITQDKRF